MMNKQENIKAIDISKTLKGNVTRPKAEILPEHAAEPTTNFERNFVFVIRLKNNSEAGL